MSPQFLLLNKDKFMRLVAKTMPPASSIGIWGHENNLGNGYSYATKNPDGIQSENQKAQAQRTFISTTKSNIKHGSLAIEEPKLLQRNCLWPLGLIDPAEDQANAYDDKRIHKHKKV